MSISKILKVLYQPDGLSITVDFKIEFIFEETKKVNNKAPKATKEEDSSVCWIRNEFMYKDFATMILLTQ